jgi:hypothetical protein
MIDALCCECGTVRKVAATIRTGNLEDTRALKCATCGTRTTHAIVYSYAPGHDWREAQNRRAGMPAANVLEATARALGVTVYHVAEPMHSPIVIDVEHMTIWVGPDLTDDYAPRAARWLVERLGERD